MKKLLSAFVLTVFLVSLFSVNVFAAYESPVNFSNVYNYDDKVYTTEFYGTNGGITFRKGNIDICSLPDSVLSSLGGNNVWNFCCYNNKIYYLAGAPASDIIPAGIYSCNMDGSGITMLADNASNYSNVYIVDNVLYYDAYKSQEWMYPDYQGYYGGIYSINLENLSWKKITADYAYICYCDGDYIYYRDGGDYYYAITTEGTNKMRVDGNCDECARYDGVLKGDTFYYIQNGSMFIRSKNMNDRVWYADVADSEYAFVASVTDDKIYWIDLKFGYYSYAYVYEEVRM